MISLIDSIQLCKKDGEVCHRSGPMGPPYNADCCDGGQCATYDSGPYGRRTGECKKADGKIFKRYLKSSMNIYLSFTCLPIVSFTFNEFFA